ncbi:MAG: chemotaxis-specific protein-glutamate methyltransferase CheB [Actinobacteria bacterium]|nr:chemotaxis-specific protein-glutamate methyltransferase CheB [Actinomycetota bacterium]
MLRVLVADDSAVFRSLLSRLLGSDPMIQVVGEAVDGRQAVTMAHRLKPDVITMDMHMPVMDGFEATRRIMETSPRPIVIVSASVDQRDVDRSFRALEAGAVALVGKPPAPTDAGFSSAVREILTTVKLMAEVKVVRRRPRSDVAGPGVRLAPELLDRVELVAIAGSTGAPAALATILGALPPDLPVPVLVVQHIAAGFEQGLVEWLQRGSSLRIRLATSRLPLRPGEVVVAPNGRHLAVARGAAILDGSGPVDGHRPSATHLFNSVAAAYGANAVGVILTGMGSDGARGLVELKRSGGHVIAQDQATSVVYGMARSAVALGAVDRVLPLDSIAAAIVEACRSNPDDPASVRARS